VNGLEFTAGGRHWRADVTAPADLAIVLEFDGAQPSFFVATPASSEPLRIGGFTGSVAQGASCNCAVHSLAPHCHGTHTECIGHVPWRRAWPWSSRCGRNRWAQPRLAHRVVTRPPRIS
jgi:arylformamidase